MFFFLPDADLECMATSGGDGDTIADTESDGNDEMKAFGSHDVLASPGCIKAGSNNRTFFFVVFFIVLFVAPPPVFFRYVPLWSLSLHPRDSDGWRAQTPESRASLASSFAGRVTAARDVGNSN